MGAVGGMPIGGGRGQILHQRHSYPPVFVDQQPYAGTGLRVPV